MPMGSIAKGGQEIMKKAVMFLFAGCMLSGIPLAPSSSLNPNPYTVEASQTLAFIVGTVKDDRGLPVAGASVSLMEPHVRGKELKSVKTDSKGNFSANIFPGLYRLRASAEGFVASVARVNLDRTSRTKYDFLLRRTDTLVEKRGDSKDYRWISQSAPRHAMNLRAEDEVESTEPTMINAFQPAERKAPASFHGMMQMLAVSGSSRPGLPGQGFFGTNFAVSGTVGQNLEMAFIGQQGAGQMAPQRLAAIATMRTGTRHQVTASVGYGQVGFRRRPTPDGDFAEAPGMEAQRQAISMDAPAMARNGSLEQVSVSATGAWQVFQPLLVIYGFDYSRFVGGNRDSVLPRFAVQYTPNSRLRLNAAITPATDDQNNSVEDFNTENIQASFEDAPAQIASAGAPILDRSQRFEVGFEKLLGDGDTSVEATAFYDMISGHGVGVLALPLEASPETQATFEQVAHRITAMNGAARGVRMMLNRRFSDHLSASIGYSYGHGSRFGKASLNALTPARMFQGSYFQVASAKVDLDLTSKTGTRVSTVIRFSPEAVVFAIDPFAGRMSVYDPNINIYVAQDLPNFGLPVRWQAIVDLRNLLDQNKGIEDGSVQLISATTRRTVRGGLSFRW